MTGINSAAATTPDSVASRLDSFRRYAPIQYEANKVLTDQQKAERRAEVFTDTALGLQTTPSNTNLYESHYQLVKDKANLLFSDEVISHYAKDKRSQMEWAQKVDALNQEIAAYEAYYEDSIGDPSKANGLGNTWADHTLRSKHQGGEQGFWSDQGVEADRTSELNEVMKAVDSRQHGSMKFNYETGEFEYDELQSNVDVFNVNPQTANELFSYNLTQTSFATPSDYATDPKLAKVTGDRTQFDQRLQTEMSKDSFRRAVAHHYINANPDAGLTIDDVMNDEVRFQDAYEDFADETYEFMESNARQLKRQSGGSGRGGSSSAKPVFGDVRSTDAYAGIVSTATPIKIVATSLDDDGVAQTSNITFQNIVAELDDNNKPKLYILDKNQEKTLLDDAISAQIISKIGLQRFKEIGNALLATLDQERRQQSQQLEEEGQVGPQWYRSKKESLKSEPSSFLRADQSSTFADGRTKASELDELLKIVQMDEDDDARDEFQDKFAERFAVKETTAGYHVLEITDTQTGRTKEFMVDIQNKARAIGQANEIFNWMNQRGKYE